MSLFIAGVIKNDLSFIKMNIVSAQNYDNRYNTLKILSVKAVVCAFVMGIINPANASTLKEIRLGDHDRYTRIVFEFEEPVKYQLPMATDEKYISIHFYNARSEKPDQHLIEDSKCVQAITTRYQEGHLTANIAVRSSRFLMNHFALESPARVVLDVACNPAWESTGTRDETNSAKIKDADMKESVQLQVVKRDPEVSIKAAVAASPKANKKDDFQKNMLVLLAAISVVIVFVIALIIFQRRSHTGKQAPDETESIRDTEDMMTALDSEIKARLTKYDRDQQ